MPVLTVENLEVVLDDDVCMVSFESGEVPALVRSRFEDASALWQWSADGEGLVWKDGDDEVRFALSPDALGLLGDHALVYFLAMHPEGGIVDSAFCTLPPRLPPPLPVFPVFRRSLSS
jgi:hypothetical protein